MLALALANIQNKMKEKEKEHIKEVEKKIEREPDASKVPLFASPKF